MKYDKEAVKRFVQTLNECQKALNPGQTIWVSMQTNGLMDVGSGYPTKWSEYIKEAERSLTTCSFQNQHLEINFRNANEVFQCSNGIENAQGHPYMNIQNILGAATAGTTVSSTIPKVFNFNWSLRRKKQCDLDNVVGRAIQELKQDMIDSEHDAYVVLVDDAMFSLDQVAKTLKSNNETNIKCYPCNKTNVEEELDQFLNNPIGCLVTPQRLFKGAECENAISLQHASNAAHNMRGNILRTVSKLVIGNGVSESDKFSMGNVIIDNQSLYCLGDCKVNMRECLTCQKSTNPSTKNGGYICNPCLISHHSGHEWEVLNVYEITTQPKCDCSHIVI